MKPSRVEALVWVLIYGGLLTVGLGLADAQHDDSLGASLIGAGGIAAAIGAALIYVRSRMR